LVGLAVLHNVRGWESCGTVERWHARDRPLTMFMLACVVLQWDSATSAAVICSFLLLLNSELQELKHYHLGTDQSMALPSLMSPFDCAVPVPHHIGGPHQSIPSTATLPVSLSPIGSQALGHSPMSIHWQPLMAAQSDRPALESDMCQCVTWSGSMQLSTPLRRHAQS